MFNNPFSMVVAIVLIVTIGRILSGRRGKGLRGVSDLGQPDADTLRMREEITMLKDRIAVLERLATDHNSTAALDREIQKLR